MSAILRNTLLFVFLVWATPVSGQWTRVPELPASDVFSVWTNGDTITATVDTAVYVSTNAGATWKRSARVANGVTIVWKARMHHGRLYAGTMGQGVFVSDDLGGTWSDYNQGLVGGLNNAQLFIIDLLIHGDSVYVATEGDGAWVRNLASGAWNRFGNIFRPEQSTNMTAIAAGASQMLACGGGNGNVFYRNPGDPDWTLSLLFNDHFAAGLAPLSATWTGSRWVVGSNIGIFHGGAGAGPWTFVDFGLRPLLFCPVTTLGSNVFGGLGAFGGTLIVRSGDGGATWEGLDTLAFAQTYDLAGRDTLLYAGRVTGLWRRSVANIKSVPKAVPPSRLRFAIPGSPESRDDVRFTFDLPQAGPIVIEVFDVAGHRVGSIRESRPQGHGEVGWDAGRLAAGVYYARLTAGGAHATARLVRTAPHRH